ncbi:MAG TPA: hypothetical protein VGO08_12950 [Burkholderiales bacterium]|jgi:uncharacterized membrane protein|nr:hypothetical protein [Burkholderiales bacterium]
MQHGSGWLWKALILPACIAYQLLVHSVLVDGTSSAARFALALIPLLALGCWVAKRARKKLLWTVGICAVAVTTYAIERRDGVGLPAMNAFTHAAINLLMLWIFGRTLLRGREPLITGFARRIHGGLAPDIEAYTRRITLMWCIFFAGQIVVSAALFALASLDTWSVFVNMLSLPLVALVFVCEYVYRVMRFRDHEHISMLKGIQVVADEPSPRAPTATPAMKQSIVRDLHG